jgi:phosphatidylglycerophosphatase A
MHVVNLMTQALIKGYSKTKHYEPEHPDNHQPDTNAIVWDEVGLIQAITVEVNTFLNVVYFSI